KRIAEQRLDAIVREKLDEAAGIIQPKSIRDGAQRKLIEHLADFIADLKSKGRAKRYVYLLGRRVEKLVEACGWTFPRDVTADSFIAWRSSQLQLSAKTLNEYLNAMNGLLNWMDRHGRIMAN